MATKTKPIKHAVSGTSTAGPMTIGPATTSGAYRTTKHSASKHSASTPIRPGAEDALHLPSRIGDHLHHRNGRVTSLSTRRKHHER